MHRIRRLKVIVLDRETAEHSVNYRTIGLLDSFAPSSLVCNLCVGQDSVSGVCFVLFSASLSVQQRPGAESGTGFCDVSRSAPSSGSGLAQCEQC